MLNLSPLRPYFGHFALILWGGLIIFFLANGSHGLDEGGAKALLLDWSIADQVASSVVTLGAPDLRALLYLPISFLWTGNIFAAKVFTAAAAALTIWLAFAWAQKRLDPETALIASGLLAITPLLLHLIDSLSLGVFLLLTFILGALLDQAYRENPRPFGGLYFTQLFLCALSTSLHPAGLAYPLALFLAWKSNPLDLNQQKQFFIGIGLAAFLTLLLKMGWSDMAWLSNPLSSLSDIFLGHAIDGETSPLRLTIGAITLLTTTIILFTQARVILSDMLGRSLFFAFALGASAADPSWGLICLFLTLYYGLPPLLHSKKLGLAARPLVLFLTIAASTIFMQSDRTHRELAQSGPLSAQDQLIHALSAEIESIRKITDEEDRTTPAPSIRVASQWPSRTMIACRCDTLPLPPPAKDPQAQLTMMRGITHIILDPKDKLNTELAHNLAYLGPTAFETIALETGGVILRRR